MRPIVLNQYDETTMLSVVLDEYGQAVQRSDVQFIALKVGVSTAIQNKIIQTLSVLKPDHSKLNIVGELIDEVEGLQTEKEERKNVEHFQYFVLDHIDEISDAVLTTHKLLPLLYKIWVEPENEHIEEGKESIEKEVKAKHFVFGQNMRNFRDKVLKPNVRKLKSSFQRAFITGMTYAIEKTLEGKYGKRIIKSLLIFLFTFRFSSRYVLNILQSHRQYYQYYDTLKQYRGTLRQIVSALDMGHDVWNEVSQMLFPMLPLQEKDLHDLLPEGLRDPLAGILTSTEQIERVQQFFGTKEFDALNPEEKRYILKNSFRFMTGYTFDDDIVEEILRQIETAESSERIQSILKDVVETGQLFGEKEDDNTFSHVSLMEPEDSDDVPNSSSNEQIESLVKFIETTFDGSMSNLMIIQNSIHAMTDYKLDDEMVNDIMTQIQDAQSLQEIQTILEGLVDNDDEGLSEEEDFDIFYDREQDFMKKMDEIVREKASDIDL